MRKPSKVIEIERWQSIREAEDADRLLNPDLYGVESLHQTGSWDLHTGDHRRDKGK